MNGWKIIGISGVTCGGKSSLVKFLKQKFEGSVSLCQDDFFLDKSDKRHVMIPELNHQNWECLDSVDWASMMDKIHDMLSSPPTTDEALFFIEGHIIYNYPPLQKLFHRKYFLTLSKEECFMRRCNRVYDPPDPPGYFDMCVWPMYCSNRTEMECQVSSIVYVDGALQMEKIQEFVFEDLRNNL